MCLKWSYDLIVCFLSFIWSVYSVWAHSSIAPLALMATSHYVWKVRAFCDGDWVGLFNTFPDSESAWTAVEVMWDMMVQAGDYDTVEVIRTIAFRRILPNSVLKWRALYQRLGELLYQRRALYQRLGALAQRDDTLYRRLFLDGIDEIDIRASALP
jgi:hypothetical protein